VAMTRARRSLTLCEVIGGQHPSAANWMG
jgi:hypothetical protein